MKRHEESHLQRQCVAWFRWQYPKYAKLLFSIPNGSFLSGDAKHRAMRWAILEAEGALPGAADLFLSVPSGGKHGAYFELKSETGRQSKEQKLFETAVNDAGYWYIVIRNIGSFKAWINICMIPKLIEKNRLHEAK